MVIFIDESGTHKQSGHAANAVVYIKIGTVRNEVSQPGIQLADALAGLVRYHFDNPNAEDATKWFGKFEKQKKLSAQFNF